jgi:hypothetical protein
MKQIVKVNTHPRPLDSDYDYHVPYIGNNYDQSEHVTASYLSEFRRHVDLDKTVYLVGRGEPVSRHIAVKKIIEKQYTDIVIDPLGNNYTNTDPLFTNAYTTVARPASFAVKELADKYLEYYPVLTKFSQRYTYENHSRDHGYFATGQRFWYQYGEDMPVAPGKEHKELYEIFDKLFQQLVAVLKTPMETIGLTEPHLRSKLMFRLNHSPPGALIDNLIVNRHADNSIVTVWMYQSQPGGYIDYGQEFEQQPTPFETLHNVDQEILLMPGIDYCDQTGCATPATFHKVCEMVTDHRVSLVAFVKN